MVGTYFINELAKLRDEIEIIGDVRGKGLMIGVELVENKVVNGVEIIKNTLAKYVRNLKENSKATRFGKDSLSHGLH